MTTPKSIDEVTAEWLDKRAFELPGTFDTSMAILEQAVEVYRVVSGLQHGEDCGENQPRRSYRFAQGCTCGRDALLTKLGQDIGLQQH